MAHNFEMWLLLYYNSINHTNICTPLLWMFVLFLAQSFTQPFDWEVVLVWLMLVLFMSSDPVIFAVQMLVSIVTISYDCCWDTLIWVA